MNVRNYTPFQPLHFESRDTQCKSFGVFATRGSFKIIDRQPLQLLPKQKGPVLVDEYHGEPGQSSIRVENSIAPYKPATDIHLDATAHAPAGKPVPVFKASVQLGTISKQLVVTGERYWQHKLLDGWRISDPAPCSQVPIRYELAYGGSSTQGDEINSCPDNFIGTGHVKKKRLDKSKPIPAPRIMSARQPVVELGKACKPQGLGPMAPAWRSRLQHAGTFDVAWEKTRWPELPKDFKFDFYNSAHPDLIYPGFVKGNEAVRLVNLSPVPEMNFTLPGYTLALLARYETGTMLPLPVHLDTIQIEPEKMQAHLTWRGIFPLDNPLRVLEIRMKTEQGA